MTTAEQKFRAVPKPIRDWFWSDEVDQAIVDIEAQFGLPEDEVIIPRLLFSVEIRDLPVRDLEQRLVSDLGVSASLARSIYEEIKVRILLPIASDLAAYDIGREELGAGGEKKAEPAAAKVDLTPPVVTAPVTIAEAPAPAAPVPLTVPPASPESIAATSVPAPVSLYSDELSAQQSVAPNPATSIGGPINSGNLVATIRRAPEPPTRAAHIDLGTHPSASSDKIESFFVERKTPKIEEIDYGAPLMPEPLAPASGTGPVTLSTSGSEMPYAPSTPQPETVSIPASSAAPAEEGGFLGSIMKKIAPWHAAKYSERKARASEVLQAPLPSETINYSETPSADAPPGGTPLPLGDLPAPPKA